MKGESLRAGPGGSAATLAGEATDKAAPSRAIVDHPHSPERAGCGAARGNIHLTLSSLRKFAARSRSIPSWSTASCSSRAS